MKRILLIVMCLLFAMSTTALADVGVIVNGQVLIKVMGLKVTMPGVKVKLIDSNGNILKEVTTVDAGIFSDLNYYFPFPDIKRNTYNFNFTVKAVLDSYSTTKHLSFTFKKSKPDEVKTFAVRMTINYGHNPPKNIPFGGFYWG